MDENPYKAPQTGLTIEQGPTAPPPRWLRLLSVFAGMAIANGLRLNGVAWIAMFAVVTGPCIFTGLFLLKRMMRHSAPHC